MASRQAKTPAVRTLKTSIHCKKSSFPLAAPMLAYLHPVLPLTLKPSPYYVLKAHCYRRPRMSLDFGTDTKEPAGASPSPAKVTVLEQTWQSPSRREDPGKSPKQSPSPIKVQRSPYRQVSIIGFQPFDSQSPTPISLISRYRDRPRPYTGAGGFTVPRKSSLPTPSLIPTQWPSSTRPSPQLARPRVLVIEARIPRPASSAQ